MFTEVNTEGFTAAELETLNDALSVLMERGWDEKNASDAINNAWVEGITSAALVSRALFRIGQKVIIKAGDPNSAEFGGCYPERGGAGIVVGFVGRGSAMVRVRQDWDGDVQAYLPSDLEGVG